ncbi:MAG: exodeoxyribonuclease large subunit, partial [Acidimicrobiaceae bacterium]
MAIAKGLRGPVWVRAEISGLRQQNSWCFLTMVEAARDTTENDATLDVVIWRTAWARIAAQLEDRGLALRVGMTVSLRGVVALRPGTGRLQLDCSALDTDALLGELAARRLALRRTLAAEGLLDANRRLPLGPAPLRIGLVASHHSQGYQDFRNVLGASGYAFVVVERPVVVQGAGAPAVVAAAITSLAGARAGATTVDLVAVVRGGGARTDLDAFDSEVVARAVAGAGVPVWTGLGHTGDRCLADDVAAASYPTPTACAQAIVSHLARFDTALCERARRLQELAGRADQAGREMLDRRRTSLARSATAQLGRHGDAAAHRATALQLAAGRALTTAGRSVASSAGRLPGLAHAAVDGRAARLRQQAETVGREAMAGLGTSEHRLRAAAGRVTTSARRAVADEERDQAGTRRVLVAFDPTRQLERGWTLTLDA